MWNALRSIPGSPPGDLFSGRKPAGQSLAIDIAAAQDGNGRASDRAVGEKRSHRRRATGLEDELVPQGHRLQGRDDGLIGDEPHLIDMVADDPEVEGPGVR